MKQKLQYLVLWELLARLEILDAVVIQYWCQETKVLMTPSPISPDPSNSIHNVIAPWTIHFSIDWKGFAEERTILETGRWIM